MININEFKKFIENKNIAVIGLGISNVPLIEFLSNFNVKITVFDRSTKEKLESVIGKLNNIKLAYSFGEEYLEKLIGFDVIFRTPGLRPDVKEIKDAVKAGATLTSEIELFFDLCKGKIISITGSDGKTTTTTLVHKLLEKKGYKTFLGGNIGTPPIKWVDKVEKNDFVVLELSSFQLMTLKKSPDISVVTNITPNHLDYHLSMKEYVDAKKNIFVHQDENKETKVILNYDNEITNGFINELKNSKAVRFSRKVKLEDGVFLIDNKIISRENNLDRYIMDVSDIKIPGVHNIENYLAAISAVRDFVDSDTIQKVANNFLGVEHRIEFVKEINGIKFYNDSIASCPTRTMAALNSFNQKVVLIAGGKDKNSSYDVLADAILKKVKAISLVGQTSDKILGALNNSIAKKNKGHDIQIAKSDFFEEAVKLAYNFSKDGDIVILSPASTSFDMFKNFEERGKLFKDIVMKLK